MERKVVQGGANEPVDGFRGGGGGVQGQGGAMSGRGMLLPPANHHHPVELRLELHTGMCHHHRNLCSEEGRGEFVALGARGSYWVLAEPLTGGAAACDGAWADVGAAV